MSSVLRAVRSPGPVLRLLALGLAAFLSLATSPARYYYPRSYPRWTVVGGGQDLWVSKSGKTGFGLSSLRKDVVSARFTADFLVADGLAPIHDSGTSIYVGFLFDNQALWNAGVRRGRLDVRFADGSVATFAMEHVRDGAHHRAERYRRDDQPPPRRGGAAPVPTVTP